LRRWSNPDSRVHVAEMIIESAMFYVHEEVSREQDYSSQTPNCTTVIIGICSQR